MNTQRNGLLSVMTWNIYQGADLAPIFTAAPGQVPERATEVFRQFLATNFPRRVRAIAHQIIQKRPDIIGLQEAVLVQLIPPNSHRVVYDFVEILLHELARRGLHYRVAAQNQNVSTELPTSTGNRVAFTDRDVILVQNKCGVRVIRTQNANFETNLVLQLNGQPLTVLRGWSAIDACFQGRNFRLINTHLEPLSPEVQVAQANELLAGPADTKLPVILIGDFNSNANGSGIPTYGNLIAAGFEDTWLAAGHGNGFTAHQDADLLSAESILSERIDLILIKNTRNLNVVEDELVGEAQADRTFTRLWPSDHAGLAARFRLGNNFLS